MQAYYELHYNKYCIFLAEWLRDDFDYPPMSFYCYVKMVEGTGIVTYSEYAKEFFK